MLEKYILDKNGNSKIENDLLKWAKWFEENDRHIGYDEINGIVISTVFLGVDYNFLGGNPILYETMILGGKYDHYQNQYYNKEEALRGHKKAVELVKTSL